MGGSQNVGTMTRKVPFRVTAILANMSRGFPLAYKVFFISAIVFSLFSLISLVASETPLYARWLEASQPFTDAVAGFVPAVGAATDFLQRHRSILEEHNSLYWIPTIRNVLSTDFALLLFFPCCFALALCIDLLRDTKRASSNFAGDSAGLGYPIGNVVLRLLICLLVFFLPVYFGFAGTANPYLMGLTATMIYYFVVLGIGGLFLFVVIYLAVSLMTAKLRARAERHGNAAPDSPSETLPKGGKCG